MAKAPELLRRLSNLVAQLRGPGGCPWDREQGLEELRAYLLEEAHEVAAAIDAGDWRELQEELGDLLFQWVFIATLAEEQSAFGLADIVEQLEAKMIARHPHVFSEADLPTRTAVEAAWEQRKLEQGQAGASLLSGVPASLPALLGAYRISQKAAAVGFDWPDASSVLDKLDEEVAELRQALAATDPSAAVRVRQELGDLLFTVANLARHLELDPEAVLSGANTRFRHRFTRMEAELEAQGLSLATADSEAMEAAWRRLKLEPEE